MPLTPPICEDCRSLDENIEAQREEIREILSRIARIKRYAGEALYCAEKISERATGKLEKGNLPRAAWGYLVSIPEALEPVIKALKKIMKK